MPKFKKGLAGIMTAAMLTTAIGTPVAAFASTTKTTDVTLTAQDDNLIVTVPSEIPFALMPSGELVAPSDEALQIVNGSSFAIRTDSVAVTPAGGLNIVSDSDFDSTAKQNTVTFKFGVKDYLIDAGDTQGTYQPHSQAQANYNMGASGDEVLSDTLNLSAAGQAKNVILSETDQAIPIAEIEWTFAAGVALT